MDYEKKYNDALERAKEYLARDAGDKFFNEEDLISYLIPELAESEDEKMCTRCIELLRKVSAYSGEEYLGVEIVDCIIGLQALRKKLKEPHIPWYDLQKSKEAGYTILKTEEYEELIKQKEQKPVEGITQDEIERGMKTLTDFKVFAAKEAKQYNISHRRDIDWHNFCASLLTYLEVNKPVGCIPDSVKFDEGFKTGREVGFREGVESVKPVEWKDEYREEDIQTRFAFYTYKDDPSTLYLSNVFVEEASRNHGFGTRILKAAEKAAEAIGATTISLKVKQDSPANAWYRKRGYGYVAFEDRYDWLEKNLEYMKPNNPVEWSEEDKDYYDTIVRKLEVIGDDSGLSDNQIKFLREHCLLNYSDWSEEDEKTINDACCWLCEYAGYIIGENKDKSNRLYELSEKLKSLRPSWKPSEQEKGALRTAIHILTDERSFPKAAAQLQNILDAFEGKESRKDWKPSEEQMEYLNDAIDNYRKEDNDEAVDVLKELRKELKKLM